jgi:hypothetical protein
MANNPYILKDVHIVRAALKSPQPEPIPEKRILNRELGQDLDLLTRALRKHNRFRPDNRITICVQDRIIISVHLYLCAEHLTRGKSLVALNCIADRVSISFVVAYRRFERRIRLTDRITLYPGIDLVISMLHVDLIVVPWNDLHVQAEINRGAHARFLGWRCRDRIVRVGTTGNVRRKRRER